MKNFLFQLALLLTPSLALAQVPHFCVDLAGTYEFPNCSPESCRILTVSQSRTPEKETEYFLEVSGGSDTHLRIVANGRLQPADEEDSRFTATCDDDRLQILQYFYDGPAAQGRVVALNVTTLSHARVNGIEGLSLDDLMARMDDVQPTTQDRHFLKKR